MIVDAAWRPSPQDIEAALLAVRARPEKLGLLRDVCESAGDFWPRLILADWLQDNGQGHDAAWAEYIRRSISGLKPRLTCAQFWLWHGYGITPIMPDMGSMPAQARPSLVMEEAERVDGWHTSRDVLKIYWPQLMSANVCPWVVRLAGGFIEALHMPGSDCAVWLERGGEVVSAQPIRGVSLTGAAPQHMSLPGRLAFADQHYAFRWHGRGPLALPEEGPPRAHLAVAGHYLPMAIYRLCGEMAAKVFPHYRSRSIDAILYATADDALDVLSMALVAHARLQAGMSIDKVHTWRGMYLAPGCWLGDANEQGVDNG